MKTDREKTRRGRGKGSDMFILKGHQNRVKSRRDENATAKKCKAKKEEVSQKWR